MQVKVIVTDEVRKTRKGDAHMQVVGVDAGGPFPLETNVYVGPGDVPAKPGQYIADGRLTRKGYDLVFDFGLRDLKPLPAGK